MLITANQKFKNSEYLYHSLVNSVNFGVEIIDLQGSILFQNKYLKRETGKDVLGKKCWFVYRDDKKQCLGCPLQKKIKLGYKETIESVGCLSGRILQVDYVAIKYQGKIVLLKTIHDISERKNNEKELLNYYNELERLNDLLVGRELKMIELKDKIKKLEKLV